MELRRVRALAPLASAALLALSCGAARLETAPFEANEARADLDRRIVGLLDAGGFGEALALADSAVSAGERSPRILGQRARALAALARHPEAVSAFEEAILADYEGCEGHLEFAIYLMRVGKTGRAHTEFMEAKAFCGAGSLPVIYRNLAVAGMKLGRPEEAERYVDEGLAEAPEDSYLLGLKAALVAPRDPAAAEGFYARALDRGESSSEFLHSYGLFLANAGRAAEAVPLLERAVASRPEDREVLLHLAEALDRSMRPRDAERILRGMLAERDDASARRALARALFRAGDFRESLELYRGLEETPETMDRIAMCFHGLGELDEALEWSRRANESKPDWPQGMINLAVILGARREIEEAERLLERVLEVDPDNAAAKSNLSILRRETGR